MRLYQRGRPCQRAMNLKCPFDVGAKRDTIHPLPPLTIDKVRLTNAHRLITNDVDSRSNMFSYDAPQISK